MHDYIDNYGGETEITALRDGGKSINSISAVQLRVVYESMESGASRV